MNVLEPLTSAISEQLKASEEALNRRRRRRAYEACKKWIEEDLTKRAGGLRRYTKEKDARSDIIGMLEEG